MLLSRVWIVRCILPEEWERYCSRKVRCHIREVGGEIILTRRTNSPACRKTLSSPRLRNCSGWGSCRLRQRSKVAR